MTVYSDEAINKILEDLDLLKDSLEMKNLHAYARRVRDIANRLETKGVSTDYDAA